MITQEKAYQAFIDSIDEPERANYSIITITPKNDVEVIARITTKTFGDGAPILKEFYRSIVSAEYVFEAGKPAKVIICTDCEQSTIIYWKNQAIWYKLTNAEEADLLHRNEDFFKYEIDKKESN